MHSSHSPFEAQAIHLLQQALDTAQQEITTTGTSSPSVKQTLHDVQQVYQDLRIEKGVRDILRAEMKKSVQHLEMVLATCSEIDRTAILPQLHELRGLYETHFAETDEDGLVFTEAAPPRAH